MVNTLLGGLRGMIGTGDYYLWDPLAAVLALRPELGTIEPRQVDVVTRGPEAGRTVDTESAGGARADVYVGADGRAAEAMLLEGLAGEPVTRIDERPDLIIEPDACTAAPGELIAGPRVLQVESGDAAVGQPEWSRDRHARARSRPGRHRGVPRRTSRRTTRLVHDRSGARQPASTRPPLTWCVSRPARTPSSACRATAGSLQLLGTTTFTVRS